MTNFENFVLRTLVIHIQRNEWFLQSSPKGRQISMEIVSHVVIRWELVPGNACWAVQVGGHRSLAACGACSNVAGALWPFSAVLPAAGGAPGSVLFLMLRAPSALSRMQPGHLGWG